MESGVAWIFVTTHQYLAWEMEAKTAKLRFTLQSCTEKCTSSKLEVTVWDISYVLLNFK